MLKFPPGMFPILLAAYIFHFTQLTPTPSQLDLTDRFV